MLPWDKKMEESFANFLRSELVFSSGLLEILISIEVWEEALYYMGCQAVSMKQDVFKAPYEHRVW